MVYCKLLSKNNEKAKYAYGSRTSDMPGLFEIRIGNPDDLHIMSDSGNQVCEYYFAKMIYRYKSRLRAGEIPERMAYEI